MDPFGGPPGPDNSIASKFLVPCGILEVLAIVLCVARIYTRFRRNSKFFVEDYVIMVAMIASISNYAVMMAAAAYGWGRHASYVSRSDIRTVMKLNFSWGLLWVFTITLIRISIACSLLRLSPSRLWKAPLYSMIVLQSLICIGYFATIFGALDPIKANWSYVPTVTFWSKRAIDIYTWITAAMMIIMDFFLALMPTILIRTLNRPPREKLLIACLMATGLLATTFACYKTSLFHTHGEGDPLITTLNATLFAKLEELFGIIAACMPCLKHPAEELLRRVGVLGEKRFVGISRPSFVVSVRGEEGGGDEERLGGLELRDEGGLLDKLSTRSESGLQLMRTRSTEGTGGDGITLRTLKSSSTMAERCCSPSERSEKEVV